ncbi:hypothetical protein Bca52824_040075 [Brassica carinata]|uniref:Uncharacterized protein n=1 Tax=Brassica carinata TaxID=52824 RepID=A0A8X7UYR0_BRACI|nr:hypothetical protein Bca52824_040075 [Brassica carinata]
MMPRPVENLIGETSGEANRKSQGTPRIKETENISLSNKYGSLGMDTDLSVSREDMVSGEENKENQDSNIDKTKNKETLREKESLVFGGRTDSMNLSKVGTKEKWAGNKKMVEEVRGKPKKLSNRPTRGLLFGPTKGEISQSESEKRLRVDKVDVGRAGGVFREKVEGIGFTSWPLHNISETEQRQITTLSNSQGDEGSLTLA